MDKLLSIKNLQVEFKTDSATIEAVRGISLEIKEGETLAIVGESGAGKSQVFHALMGLLPNNGKAQGDVNFFGQALLNQPANVLNKIRGKQIGMIFQDPMTALNPYLRIGKQLTEVLEIHQDMPAKEAKIKAIQMLEKVHIKQPKVRFDSYPHELSGGMRQRVVIAMALLCEPQLIIADEPTTALDVTVQTEIIRLLREIHQSLKTSIVLITHDLPLVAGLCERIIVMYAGRIVESGTVKQIFHHAKHPYTKALLAATPANTQTDERLQAIDGQPPDPLNLPTGCAFHPRCAFAEEACFEQVPALVTLDSGQQFACVLAGKDSSS
jgi:oligopeptide transport system ATP-binding protein